MPHVLDQLLVLLPSEGSIRDAPFEVLILGAGVLARHTGLQILEEASRRKVLGHLSFPGEVIDERLEAPVLGAMEDLEHVLRAHAISEVYLAEHPLQQGEVMQEAIHTCERFGVPFALPASSFRFSRARPMSLPAITDGYVHYVMVEYKPHQLAAKRAFDVVVSSTVLLVLAPLFVVVALLIVLTSRGPVFFAQERVGRHGQPFKMLKFRSMVRNAEALQAGLMDRNEQSGPVFKIERDPRITSAGRLLRKFSLDELPQFINVLRGDMSIVGPRPPLPGEVAKYESWQRRRLSVPPGITCVWQVSGRNDTSFEKWMYLDMQYIDHWSLMKDVKLILKTLPVVLSGRGAS
jgi:exopolysaccharide biosynthesis polyprenyl glycosylphosphotransferase